MRFIFALVLTALSSAAAFAADIKGTWLVEDGDAKIAFEPCGANMCGKIVWLKDQKAAQPPLLDQNNESANLRTRPLLGLRLTEFSPNGSSSWKGTLYNPEDGKTYAGEGTMQPDGKLKVKGCVLGGLICEDQAWTRVH